MFKEYRFIWDDGGRGQTVTFFVHARLTRAGIVHRACARGPLPRTDGGDGTAGYMRNTERLYEARIRKISHLDRPLEPWPGQTCLSRLWAGLAKLRFTDMGRIAAGNPFEGYEPDHRDLPEPEVVFSPFGRRA